MLEVTGLSVGRDSRSVLEGIDMNVAAGEIVALIGHNGAGKTTLLRTIMGLVRPSGGTISALGGKVQWGDSAAVARRGLAFVPQGRNVFRDLSVHDNLALARESYGPDALPEDVVFDLFPVLRERIKSIAGSLSGGQQQMLGVALALLRRPRLIMLDEPSTGLAPVLVETLFGIVVSLRRDYGISLLIVDQNVHALLAIADRVYALKSGRMVFTGNAAELSDGTLLWSLF